MPNAEPTSVVILYAHPLLGEGLAHLLSVEPGLHVVPVSIADAERAEWALAAGPDVVIVEHRQHPSAVDLLKLAPNALLIELGVGSEPTFTYRREEIPGQPEGILGAIRAIRERTLVALAPAPGA